ncbi:limonene-1,2-epoxide hydrolase family protein [Streptomyces sp. NPDC005811]|uniref:limonene-1,2-epoxide hydrolase family protein n=1 Tax=Streptomyces sp. NPDC005811 TaxID=3154565 RepID=UPI0033DAF76D
MAVDNALGQAFTYNRKTELTAEEKANVELVNSFVMSFWNPEEILYSSIAPDGVVRTAHVLPPTVGPEGCREQIFQHLKSTDRVDVKIHDTFAEGPIVVNIRTDIVQSEDKPDQPFPLVGVFYLKDGRIQEWTDYVCGAS